MEKKLLLNILISFCCVAQGQCLEYNKLSGAWINVKVAEQYLKYQENGEVGLLDEKLTPLYMSFLDNNEEVELTLRLEQKRSVYKVNCIKGNNAFIVKGTNRYEVVMSSNDTVLLFFNQSVVKFIKVSDVYSSDVFGDFIKMLIFPNNENYVVNEFKSSSEIYDLSINRMSFKSILKEIFQVEYLDFVQLGCFSYDNSCVPEIALYNEKDFEGPKVIGILIKGNKVKFIDTSGNILLTMGRLN